jgi:hypothetical protein
MSVNFVLYCEGKKKGTSAPCSIFQLPLCCTPFRVLSYLCREDLPSHRLCTLRSASEQLITSLQPHLRGIKTFPSCVYANIKSRGSHLEKVEAGVRTGAELNRVPGTYLLPTVRWACVWLFRGCEHGSCHVTSSSHQPQLVQKKNWTPPPNPPFADKGLARLTASGYVQHDTACCLRLRSVPVKKPLCCAALNDLIFMEGSDKLTWKPYCCMIELGPTSANQMVTS